MNTVIKKQNNKSDDKVASRTLYLIKFIINFSTINLLFLLVLSLAFLLLVPFNLKQLITVNSDRVISFAFLAFTSLGQVGLINLILMLAIFVVIMCFKWVLRSSYYDFFLVLLTSFFMAILVLLLVLDISVYHLMGYHLTMTFWDVLFSGAFFQVIVLSNIEWMALLAGFFVFLMLEVILALWLWQKTQFKLFSWLAVSLCLLIFSLTGFSYTYYFFNQSSSNTLPQLTRVIPYFSTMTQLLLPIDRSPEFVYPRYPLQFYTPKKPLNVLMIVIDTWRSDMLAKDTTPNIWALAQQSLLFTNHYSGGNFTQPGIFSLMYGLPAVHWSQMQKQRQGPLLIHQLLEDHYQMAIFPSASPRFPDFVDTVFHEVPSAWQDTPGLNSIQRDLNITNEFESFITSRDSSRPFFGFLFYDAVHNWCGDPEAFATPFQPSETTCDRLLLSQDTNPLPYLNRYKNAVHYDDQLIGNIINELQQRGLLENTIIIVTADHGEEFNDTHQGLWGHGSAFDEPQLHVPFVMYWPGMAPHIISYRTSHYDIVPTLMSQVLGCLNEADDYSDGVSLFSAKRPSYIELDSYGHHAELYSHFIKVDYSGGYSTKVAL